MSRFEVSKAGFEEHRVADVAKRELADGEVRLAIDFFAFTANNMTYAVAFCFLIRHLQNSKF